MVRCIINKLNIGDRNFLTSRGTMIGSFKAKELKQMYHILDPDKIYDKEFLAHFAKENELKSTPIKQWMINPNKHTNNEKGMYSTKSLASTYCYISAMMSRIFG